MLHGSLTGERLPVATNHYDPVLLHRDRTPDAGHVGDDGESDDARLAGHLEPAVDEVWVGGFVADDEADEASADTDGEVLDDEAGARD